MFRSVINEKDEAMRSKSQFYMKKTAKKPNQQSSVILCSPEILQCIVCLLLKHQTHVCVKHLYYRVSSLWFQHILICLSPTSDFLLRSAGQTCWFYGSEEKKREKLSALKKPQTVCVPPSQTEFSTVGCTHLQRAQRVMSSLESI